MGWIFFDSYSFESTRVAWLATHCGPRSDVRPRDHPSPYVSQSKAGDLPVSGWIGLSLDSGLGPRCLPRRGAQGAGGWRPSPPPLNTPLVGGWAGMGPLRPPASPAAPGRPVPLSSRARDGGGAHACRGRRRGCVPTIWLICRSHIRSVPTARSVALSTTLELFCAHPRTPSCTFHTSAQPIPCPPLVPCSSLVPFATPANALHYGCRRSHQLGHCPHRHVRFEWDARQEGWHWSGSSVLLCSSSSLRTRLSCCSCLIM